MPYGSRARFGLDIETANQPIDLPHQHRLFSAELVDIDNAVRAGRSDVGATGIERKVFCGLRQVAEIEHLISIGNIDDLYGELATGYQYFNASNSWLRTHSLATAAHCPSGDRAISRIGSVHRVSIFS